MVDCSCDKHKCDSGKCCSCKDLYELQKEYDKFKGENEKEAKLIEKKEKEKKDCDKKIQIAYDNRISALAVINDSIKSYKKRIIAFMFFLFLISLALTALKSDSENCIAVLIFLYAVIISLLYLVTILCKTKKIVHFPTVKFIKEELSTDNTSTARLEECEKLETVFKEAQKSLSLISNGLNLCIATFLLITAIIPILFFMEEHFSFLDKLFKLFF